MATPSWSGKPLRRKRCKLCGRVLPKPPKPRHILTEAERLANRKRASERMRERNLVRWAATSLEDRRRHSAKMNAAQPRKNRLKRLAAMRARLAEIRADDGNV